MNEQFLIQGIENPISVGDNVQVDVTIKGRKNSFGFVFTEELKDALLEKELLTPVIKKGEYNPIRTIAERLGWSTFKVEGYLKNLSLINKPAVTHVLLKELAINLDKSYPDHISKSPQIFVITHEGIVKEMPKEKIKSYKNFAAFRTYDDALTASILCEALLESLYGRS